MLEIQRPVLYPCLARCEVHGHKPAGHGRQKEEQQRRANTHYYLPRGPRHVQTRAHARAVVYHRAPVVGVVVEETPDPVLVLVHIVARAALRGEPLLRPPHGEFGPEADVEQRKGVDQGRDHEHQAVINEEPERHGQQRREPGHGYPDLAPVVAPHAGQRGVHAAVGVHHVGPLPEDERVKDQAQRAAERKGAGHHQPCPALADVFRGERQHAGDERDYERRDEEPARERLAQLLRLCADVHHHRTGVGRHPALLRLERAQADVEARKDHEKHHERDEDPEKQPGQGERGALDDKGRDYRRREDEKP